MENRLKVCIWAQATIKALKINLKYNSQKCMVGIAERISRQALWLLTRMRKAGLINRRQIIDTKMMARLRIWVHQMVIWKITRTHNFHFHNQWMNPVRIQFLLSMLKLTVDKLKHTLDCQPRGKRRKVKRREVKFRSSMLKIITQINSYNMLEQINS